MVKYSFNGALLEAGAELEEGAGAWEELGVGALEGRVWLELGVAWLDEIGAQVEEGISVCEEEASREEGSSEEGISSFEAEEETMDWVVHPARSKALARTKMYLEEVLFVQKLMNNVYYTKIVIIL